MEATVVPSLVTTEAPLSSDQMPPVTNSAAEPPPLEMVDTNLNGSLNQPPVSNSAAEPPPAEVVDTNLNGSMSHPPVSNSAAEPRAAELVDANRNGSTEEDPFSTTKLLKFASNVEIPIHIPVAQPSQPKTSNRGRRKLPPTPTVLSPPLRKIAPAPSPLIFIKSSKPIVEGEPLTENVMNDPAIQEMLSRHPGQTLTIVRLPEDELNQVGELPPDDPELLNNPQTLQLMLTNEQTPTPVRTPGKPGRKRKRKKTEEVEEEMIEEVVETHVTRSGRVVKRPAYQGRYYVGSRGKSSKTSEEEEGEDSGASGDATNTETGDVSNTEAQTKQNETIPADPGTSSIKKGRGRPRKNPLPEGGVQTPKPRDFVPKYQINRLAKMVDPWEFTLMKVIAQHQSKPWRSFYEELLEEFKTFLGNMRSLSAKLLEQIPESSTPTEKDNETLFLTQSLATILEQSKGLHRASPPSQDLLPERVLKWLGVEASMFPKSKEGEPNQLTSTVDDEPPQDEGTEATETLPQIVENSSSKTQGPVATADETPPQVTNAKEPTLASAEDPATVTTQIQGALVPPGSVIMEMENGTFMAETPAGATMEIQAPDNMSLEALSALLDQATGATEQAAEGQEPYIVNDGRALAPVINPKAMIGGLRVNRSIQLSRGRGTEPTTVPLQP